MSEKEVLLARSRERCGPQGQWIDSRFPVVPGQDTEAPHKQISMYTEEKNSVLHYNELI